MKNRKKIVLIVGIIVILIFTGVTGLFIAKEFELKDKLWLSLNVNIVQDKALGDEIYAVENKKNVSMWNLNYQNTINNKIDKMVRKNDYSMEHPLIIYNPFGSNTCSVNAYFNSENECKITYTVTTDKASFHSFTETLYTKENYTKKHEYQIIGLVPNEINKVSLTALDENDSIIMESSFTVTMGGLQSDTAPDIDITEGESTQKLTEGLFALFGHDKSSNACIYLYDNDGIIRSELPLRDYRSDRILFIGDKMLYSYSLNRFALVNRLGKIEQTYGIKNWEMHHDFVYDEVNNKLLILSSDEGDTVEDIIVSLDLESGEATELLDFKDYMSEVKDKAIISEEKKENGEKLDWIHFNTIQVVNGKDLILSSRELSTIIRINNVYKSPELKYFIADDTVWKGTSFEKLNLKKEGEFVSQAGQHSVTYIEEEALPEGQYYLIMFNNNYRGASSRPDFDWSAYPGTGTMEKGKNSMFYRYLVDEKAGTYHLVESFDIPYSSIVSSVQEYGENYVTGSGRSQCYGEYDNRGALIRQFNYTAEQYAYRVFKYSFRDFLFQ